LLSLLINYTNRISGSTDMMVGENPGQNTPAETSRTMVEQGAKIYSAIFKRIWRSMREEFKKLYLLNGTYLPDKQEFGEQGWALREDYIGDSNVIVPVADPNVVSENQKMQQVMALKQAAASTPGYNVQEVEHRYLKALHVDGIEQVYPGADKVPPLPNPKMAVEQMKLEAKKQQMQQEMMMFVAKLQEERQLNAAKILELHAKSAKEMEEAGGVRTGHEIAMFEAAIGALKVHDESLARQVKMVMEGMNNDNGTGLSGVENPPGHAGAQQAVAGMA